MNNRISKEELAEINAMVWGPPTVSAFGGAYDGAARFEKQIAGWSPPLQSADADIMPEKELLDARSRDMARNDAYVQGAAEIHKDSVVGAFFLLNAKPALRTLGLDEAWAEEFQTEVEEKFTLWAESPLKWVDAARENDFTGLIRLAVGVYTFGGEALATVEYPKDKAREFRTAIQMVDCDRLSTPETMQYDRRIRAGIKKGAYGEPISAFIRTTHPGDYMLTDPTVERWWKEVPFYKPWGRQQVIFMREQKRVDQTRGIGTIVAALKEISITRKFRDVTLQNAVVNAMYAASIESELPDVAVYEQLGASSSSSGIINYAESFLNAVNDYVKASKHMAIDGVKVPHLFPGTKLQLRPAGSPGGVGEGFEQSLIRYIAASLDVSYEELSRDFSKTNYSSARAAMALTGRTMASRKRAVAVPFATAIYRLWLEEAVNNDRLTTFPKAKAGMLYTNRHLNTMFDALSQCDWIGAAQAQIDELKETQAAVLRIKFGLSTHEDELARLGKDWRKVYAQLEREAKERERRKIVLLEDNSVNAASGSPREQQDDGTGAKNADE